MDSALGKLTHCLMDTTWPRRGNFQEAIDSLLEAKGTGVPVLSRHEDHLPALKECAMSVCFSFSNPEPSVHLSDARPSILSGRGEVCFRAQCDGSTDKLSRKEKGSLIMVSSGEIA